MITPVIMCGGAGTRLWPASREDRPKQFIRLFGEQSTFQDTLLRVNDETLFAQPLVITNADFEASVVEQAAELGVAIDVVLEPLRRDSGPAVAVAAHIARMRDPNANVLVLAADHAMPNVAAFRADCRKAVPAVVAGHIVTFGIRPTEPKTSYGYLEPGTDLGMGGVHKLRRFVEKPDRATAETYSAKGYLWNSGNFFFRADAMWHEIERHAPEMSSAAMAAVDQGDWNGSILRLSHDAFMKAPKNSIDYSVMEKTDQAAVLPASFSWSDIGSWDAVWELSEKDKSCNAVYGDNVHVKDAKNVLVRGEPDILTAVVGIDDVVVVVTKDAVLVTSRAKCQQVKGMVDDLKQRALSQAKRFDEI